MTVTVDETRLKERSMASFSTLADTDDIYLSHITGLSSSSTKCRRCSRMNLLFDLSQPSLRYVVQLPLMLISTALEIT